MSYIWRGKIYKTQRAVAEAAGCHPDTVWNHLDEYGNLDKLGCYIPGPYPVELDGETWPSRKAFAEFCGVATATASVWVNTGKHDVMRRAVAKAKKVEHENTL